MKKIALFATVVSMFSWLCMKDKDKLHNEEDEDNRPMNNLARAINAQTEWFKANVSSATKQDLAESEARIIAAIRKGRATDAELLKLSSEIDASTAPLKEAVKENQPPAGA